MISVRFPFFHALIASITKLVMVLMLLCLVCSLHAQTISGFVMDEMNVPVPFANVYIKNTQTGTAADAQGRYYLQLNDPGVIDLVVTAIGYQNAELKVKVAHREDVVQNFYLVVDQTELQEVAVNAKKRDP
ncbi:MAG: carboxypeptidase-like regulatory domain-containing protein, partial [Salibacteraceae bacterium]|nr:carboxypeptidase-like regulatory domain-containing protein [Salibacteraceae bacterium]